MDAQLVELSRTVDPAALGRRLRLARLAAGMTQQQVTQGEVSAAYLSRIEAGQRRPEVGLLTRMAERIGVPLADLVVEPVDEEALRLQVDLDHAELLLVSAQAAEALAAVAQVVADLGETSPAELGKAARFVHARALEATGDYNEAILLLEDLTADPASDSAWLATSWLKAAITLCRC